MTDNREQLDAAKAAMESVRHLITQLLTLSTALIAATVAFSRFLPAGPIHTIAALTFLMLLLISAIFGLAGTGALISHLVNQQNFRVAESSLISGLAIAQIGCFTLGICVSLGYAVLMVFFPVVIQVLSATGT